MTAINGQVTTTLKSGTKAGTVKVIAFIDANGNNLPDATEIASQAISVVITGGPPWGENLSVAEKVSIVEAEKAHVIDLGDPLAKAWPSPGE